VARVLCVGARLFDQGIEQNFPIPVPLHRLPEQAYLKIDGSRVEILCTGEPTRGAELAEISREELQRISTKLRSQFPAVKGFAVPQADY
jgi:hypothetical protein